MIYQNVYLLWRKMDKSLISFLQYPTHLESSKPLFYGLSHDKKYKNHTDSRHGQMFRH